MRFFITLLLALPVTAGAWEPVSPVSNEAMRILRNTRETHYTHDPVIDERRGRYDVDCSAFGDYVLERSNREAARELKDISTGKRPLARDFVNLFGAVERQPSKFRAWMPLRYVRHLKPGDLIGWLIPEGSTSKDTGHVMVVVSEPKKSPRYANEYLVTVIDGAVSGHGKLDPRRKAGPNGVGRGVVGISVDANDRPNGFYWSGGESDKLKLTTVRLGRTK